MVIESPPSAKFPSTEVSNFWVSPISTEPVDPCLLIISKLPMIPQAGGMVVPTIITVPLSCGELITTSLLHGVVTSLPVLLTLPRVQRMYALLHTAYVMTPFVVGVVSAWGLSPRVSTLSGIRWSIVVGMIGRVRLINNFCCKIPLPVLATFLFFPSLVRVDTLWSLCRIKSCVIFVWFIIANIFDCKPF